MFAIMGRDRWYVPLVVLLGVLSAVLEGVSLYLLIPLLDLFTVQNGTGWADNAIVGWLNRIVELVPEAWRVEALLASVTVGFILKSTVRYLYWILWDWLDNRLYVSVYTRLYDQLLSISQTSLDKTQMGALANTFQRQSIDAIVVIRQLTTAMVEGLAMLLIGGLRPLPSCA